MGVGDEDVADVLARGQGGKDGGEVTIKVGAGVDDGDLALTQQIGVGAGAGQGRGIGGLDQADHGVRHLGSGRGLPD